ncbi:TetR/AcrR family transcriptional regulator C-terminal domain-containing protein [Streptomyces sp. ODS28]|uniref:TetR/AcrR family transcriptional regulator n=1 Tax=Streptomyces sp. ODS28 TaxID=3136688 RepID=UPI0031F10D1A
MGRPRKALLDRERIGAVALELVDATGDFSVPAIARRLGVQTGSVYHHVDGRAGIVELLRERIGGSIDASTLESAEWDTALDAWARSYRAAFAAHPRAIPLLTGAPVRTPTVLAQYERAVVLLLGAGFPRSSAIAVLTGLENVVLGSALDMAAPREWLELPGDDSTPELARAVGESEEERADEAFELALTGYLLHVRSLLG